MLAGHGYASLAVGYFGLDGLPDQLVSIPLESLAAGIRWLAAHAHGRRRPRRSDGHLPRVRGAAVGGWLGSTGLGVRALIAVSPSSVSWGALGDDGTIPDTPSWTVGGEPVPSVAMSDDTLIREVGRRGAAPPRPAQPPRSPTSCTSPGPTPRRCAGPQADAAAIPVERIAVPILCLSGDDDQVWPSGPMAAAIAARRANGTSAAGADDEQRHYADAGHLIRLGLLATTVSASSGVAFGGTPEGNAAAQVDATAAVLRFLARTIGS